MSFLGRYVTSAMLLPGETVYEARERIRAIRALRAERRALVDKLAERDRLTRFWKAAMPEWQPELCRISPSFARVHIGAFRPGMIHGNLSLLPGHVPPHNRNLQYFQALRKARTTSTTHRQLPLWPEAQFA